MRPKFQINMRIMLTKRLVQRRKHKSMEGINRADSQRSLYPCVCPLSVRYR